MALEAEAAARRSYRTLDGLRGLAAIIVATRHLPWLFPGNLFPESWLAVDLFFLLSGFVIAHSYQRRLEGGPFFWAFVKIRLIRLYPLYLLGTCLGLAYALIREGHGGLSDARLVQAAVAAAFMLPSLRGVWSGGSTFDGPTWSLFPELVGNFVYAALSRHMTVLVIGLFMALGASGMVLAIALRGDFGLPWQLNDYWITLSRVSFSFFCGILIQRFHNPERRTSTFWALVVLAVSACCLLYTPPTAWRRIYELAMILGVFPLIVLAACHVEPGARLGAVASVLGVASYAVYVLHQPLGMLLHAVEKRVWEGDTRVFAPMPGLVFLAAVVLLAVVVDALYDRPVRKWLTARFVTRRPVPTGGSTQAI